MHHLCLKGDEQKTENTETDWFRLVIQYQSKVWTHLLSVVDMKYENYEITHVDPCNDQKVQ